jgi:hypothetical protein
LIDGVIQLPFNCTLIVHHLLLLNTPLLTLHLQSNLHVAQFILIVQHLLQCPTFRGGAYVTVHRTTASVGTEYRATAASVLCPAWATHPLCNHPP